MFHTIAEDLILYQLISYNKKYSNYELKFYQYFHLKTEGIYPEFVVIIGKFIFFFVKNKHYFNSKIYLDSMRREIKSKKILIVRAENVFIRFLFSLFPDLYIHDIALEFDNTSGKRKVIIFFLTFKERGIAIGRGAEYIRAVNELFKSYIIFENGYRLLEIECKNLYG